MGVKAYSLSSVNWIHGGVPISTIGGAGESDFFTPERVQADFEFKEGADGSVTRSATNSKLAKITLKTMQSSDVNGVLSALLANDVKSPGGAGIVPGVITDLPNGTTGITYSQGWIAGPPACPFGKEAQEREWTFYAYCEIYFVGGN